MTTYEQKSCQSPEIFMAQIAIGEKLSEIFQSITMKFQKKDTTKRDEALQAYRNDLTYLMNTGRAPAPLTKGV